MLPVPKRIQKPGRKCSEVLTEKKLRAEARDTVLGLKEVSWQKLKVRK